MPSLDYSFGVGEKFLVLLLCLPIGAVLIYFFLSHSIIGYSYRLFVAPGVIVHELAHAIGCLITGAKVTSLNVFEKEGGRVEHTKSKIPLIGQIIISTAPMVAGVAAIYFLAKFVGFRTIDLIGVPLSLEGVKGAVLHLISSIDIHDRKNWLVLYLLVSLAVTMTPSKQDLKNIVLSIILLSIVVYLTLRFTSVRFHLMEYIPPQLIMVIGTIDLVLILVLAFSIIICVLSKLIKKS
jgi:hypothetical protein